MEKKRRKDLIKLNNRIKAIFKGKAFEHGILELGKVDLERFYYELFQQNPSEDGDIDETIRAIRRVWSSGDYQIRKEMVDWLVDYKKSPTKEDIKKIVEELLGFEELNDREFSLLIESFSDINLSKITKKRLLSKLNYIRLKERVCRVEKSLNITFTTLDEIEFIHTFKFDIVDEPFSKLILLKSEPFESDSFWSRDDDEIKKRVEYIKSSLIDKKVEEIEKFISSLRENIYLDLKEARGYLKKLPIDCELQNTPIETDHLKSVIERGLSSEIEISIKEIEESFEIERWEQLEVFGEQIRYKTALLYEKNLLYSLIWNSLELPFLKDFEQFNGLTVDEFNISLSSLYKTMRELSIGIDISDSMIEGFILKELKSSIGSSKRLKIKSKSVRRVLYHFEKYLKPIKEQKRKEELLSKSIRDFKLLYPIARSLKRKITFNVGPTNSGKTHSAIERLKGVDSGYYLAPLRLLALEGYESLKSSGINVSLITGEEEIIDEESTHISSTIEMLNFSVEVELCVIDEIQMIADKDRGWAWVNALIGAPAKEVILTGSSSAMSVVKELCDYLGEELTVKTFKRKNPLHVLEKPISIERIRPHSAIITFSRYEVLSLKEKLSSRYSVSVIYGNLSPEVRREEAKRFREGESSILIATDAISMGLNLPIESIIFAKSSKFDGFQTRELKPIEVVQIAGRAGRYGLHEEGFIGALDRETLKSISDKLRQNPKQITPPLRVKATLEHIMLIGEIIRSDSLFEILKFFSKNMEFEGPFIAGNIKSMLVLAGIVDMYSLDLRTKYIFASSPVTLHSNHLETVFHQYLVQFQNGENIPFKSLKTLPLFAKTQEELLEKEDRVKEVSLYLWLSFKFPDRFRDVDRAEDARRALNLFIESSLKRGELKKMCRVCKKRLDFSYRYNICEVCFYAGGYF